MRTIKPPTMTMIQKSAQNAATSHAHGVVLLLDGTLKAEVVTVAGIQGETGEKVYVPAELVAVAVAGILGETCG
ncbi:hypothetical protein Leryth_008072 [Lithospermum erythrorhizon]|nr:hypothetical protein Leryth_008072 [Lithospermum erythrorhizon]